MEKKKDMKPRKSELSFNFPLTDKRKLSRARVGKKGTPNLLAENAGRDLKINVEAADPSVESSPPPAFFRRGPSNLRDSESFSEEPEDGIKCEVNSLTFALSFPAIMTLSHRPIRKLDRFDKLSTTHRGMYSTAVGALLRIS